MNEQKSTSKLAGFVRSWLSGNEPTPMGHERLSTMSELTQWQLGLIGLLLAILFSFISLDINISLQSFYLFCVIGLIVAFRKPNQLRLSDSEKIGFMIIFIFCLISLFTFWVNGMPGKGNLYIEGRHGKFLLAICAYYFFRSYYIPNRLIWAIAIFVATELLLIAIVDLLSADGFGWPGRASGNTHPIYFGIQALMMAVLILAFRDEWSRGKITGLIARIGILAAVVALIATGSRSVWLAAPFIGVMYLSSRTEKLQVSYILKVVTVVTLSCVMLYQLPPIKDRWSEAINEFNDYQISESVDDPVRVSSLGARLEMWRAARIMILDNPLLGVGTGGYQVVATQYYENGGWAHDIAKRNGPHNQYLNAWASRGIVGLIAIILILVGPFLYCYRVRRDTQYQDIKQLALAGMMIVVIFAVSGLSDDTLEKKPLIILYLTSLTLLLGQIRHRTLLESKN